MTLSSGEEAGLPKSGLQARLVKAKARWEQEHGEELSYRTIAVRASVLLNLEAADQLSPETVRGWFVEGKNPRGNYEAITDALAQVFGCSRIWLALGEGSPGWITSDDLAKAQRLAEKAKLAAEVRDHPPPRRGRRANGSGQ